MKEITDASGKEKYRLLCSFVPFYKNLIAMKHLPAFILLSFLFVCSACSKDKTESPFIGIFLGNYSEVTIGSSISLSDVTATIEGKTNNKLSVKLDLDLAGTTLEAQVVTDTQIFFPPQDYFGEEISGTGTLSDAGQKLSIEMERTSGPTKTFQFSGTRQ